MQGALQGVECRVRESWCRLVEGKDLQTVLEAVQKKARKLKAGGRKLLELKAWVWHFSMHLAYALAQVCHSMVFCL